MKHTFWKNERAEAEQGGLGAILAIIGAVVVAVVYFALVPMLGSKIDDAADVPSGSQWNKSTNDDIATGYRLIEHLVPGHISLDQFGTQLGQAAGRSAGAYREDRESSQATGRTHRQA